MYRLVRKSVKLFCPFVPKRRGLVTKKDRVYFYARNNMPKTIFRIRRNSLSATLAGSVVNSSKEPITVVFKKRPGIVSSTIKSGSSISFVHNQVQKIKVLGTTAPYKGTFDYQAIYKK